MERHGHDSHDPLRLDVDLRALRRNHDRIVAQLPAGTKLIYSVKANAYGHGVLGVVRELERLGVDVDGVATASIRDAIRLRQAGVECRILLFGGHMPAAAPALAARGVTITVANVESARAMAEAADRAAPVFVKVDSGLGRLGLALDEAEEVIAGTLLPGGVTVEGIYTHLPFGDEIGERWARAGLERFESLVERLRGRGIDPPIVQALSSPGVAAGLPLVGNAVCAGRLLYGLVPAVGDAGSWGLEPVLRGVSTQVVHTNTHAVDARIGAGGRHVVRAGDTTVVIPFGRSAGNLMALRREPALVHRGERAPLIAISLEHATLNVGSTTAAVGDEVTILGGDSGGPSVTLDELARWSHLEPLDALVALDRGGAI
jgi:alanine racemase